MDADALRFVVVGIEHPHVFELVDGLLAAGAIDVGHHGGPGRLLEAYEAWRPDSRALGRDEALNVDADLVVLAGVPGERGDDAVAALGAGKSVLADKPGVTTLDQLERVVAAATESPGRWWVLFSERFGNPAVLEAVRRARSGAVGRVVEVIGMGPHTLSAGQRPDWFWSPATSGGILGDLATHQLDQFCAIVDPQTEAHIEVVSSRVGNVACPDHPDMQDIGRLTVAGGGAVGTHRVDYLTAAGLGSWGDCRLFVIGTEGTLEVRANIDPAGHDGGAHLIQVDADGTARIDVSEVRPDWAERLIADVLTGSDTLLSARHVERVCRLAVTAQARAVGWDDIGH